jgi:hypothetical protein
MNLLVLAPEKLDADTVRAALPGEDLDEARILLVSPALNDSPIKFWTSDADEARNIVLGVLRLVRFGCQVLCQPEIAHCLVQSTEAFEHRTAISEKPCLQIALKGPRTEGNRIIVTPQRRQIRTVVVTVRKIHTSYEVVLPSILAHEQGRRLSSSCGC